MKKLLYSNRPSEINLNNSHNIIKEANDIIPINTYLSMALKRYVEEDVVQQTTHKFNINSHNFIKLILCRYLCSIAHISNNVRLL